MKKISTHGFWWHFVFWHSLYMYCWVNIPNSAIVIKFYLSIAPFLLYSARTMPPHKKVNLFITVYLRCFCNKFSIFLCSACAFIFMYKFSHKLFIHSFILFYVLCAPKLTRYSHFRCNHINKRSHTYTFLAFILFIFTLSLSLPITGFFFSSG